ncbi:MAG: oxidoreductase [Chloroflexota bacterium]
MKWTTDDIPAQTGKIAIVTGASAGIGRATTTILASKGAEVVLAVRNAAKGEGVVEAIQSRLPDAKLRVMALDLSKLSSARSFSAEFLATFDRLDILVNNAGIYDGGDKTTAEGFALQMGVNHFGHFALTGLLLGRLLSTPQSRVVTVSSGAYRGGKIDLSRFHTVEAAKKGGYGNSKLANMLFALELQSKLAINNTNILSVSAGPGATKSDGAKQGIQSISNRFMRRAVDALTDVLMVSSEVGAMPIVRAATDPHAKGGDYFVPSGFMGMRGGPVGKEPKLSAEQEALLQGFWEKSAELTGIDYDVL